MKVGGRANARNYQRAQETTGGDGQVHYLDCGDGFTVLICVKVDQIVDFKYV